MLIEIVRKTIAENQLLDKGDTVICAVSGGADSVCLLKVMLSLKDEYRLNIVVANVNHKIRGEESDRDSQFVENLCKLNNIELFYREYDVINIARERKIGEEECGRILRYEFFEEISEKLNGAKIATAHNLNDNAETILFRMIRGSSSLGISGIKYKRGNIIRPLLNVKRCEIEKYLHACGQEWQEDSTNTKPVYTRNKIRLSVMPLLEEISHCAQNKMVTASMLISEDNMLLDEMAEKIYKECFFDTYLLTEPVLKAPLPLARRVAKNILKAWKTEVSYERIRSFLEFMKKDSGKKFDINDRCYAEKNYDRINLRESSIRRSSEMCIEAGEAVFDTNWTLKVEVSEFPQKKTDNNVAVFDAEKVNPPFTVRYRRDGDKISLKGINGTKKLSDIFTDEKIQRYLRDYIPIVEKDGDILYVCGLRQSGLYAVDKNTKKFLILKYFTTEERKDKNGRYS